MNHLSAVTVFFLTMLSTPIMHAQTNELDKSAFDFWLGTWRAEWVNADGSQGRGVNAITSILNGKVLHEHFVDTASHFEGMSMSVLDPRDSLWHQAWADDQGSYFNFVGGVIDGSPCFSTVPVEQAGMVLIQRMRFEHITPASFTWDWERSEDGGRTWVLKWRIGYTRIGS